MRTPDRAICLAVALLTIAVTDGASGMRIAGQAEPPIALVLRNAPASAAHAAFEEWLPAVSRFYTGRDFTSAWTTTTGFSAAGDSVLRVLRRAADDGLNPEEYDFPAFARAAAARDGDALARLDVLMSLAVVRYARDLGWGVTLPSEVDSDNAYDERPFVGDEVLGKVASAPHPGIALSGFAPPGVAYPLVKEGLAKLRAAQARGWSTVSAGSTLRAGDRGPRVQELRARLTERGDLSADSPASDSFDASVVAAVKQFQDRHGLEPDGVYGPKMVSELNVPLATRIQQVRLGLERLRWLPPSPPGRRIGVNLADFKAYVFEGDQVIFETRTVIGKEFHETPMFSRMMTYMVINPYWNVPASIVRREILPKVKEDPDYLARHHMEMNGNAIRQLPGPWNSLGRFKFMFPNQHNIYMHDTPARAAFARADRTGSHGCIRLEKPAELAALLLGPQGWAPERIAAAVATGEQTVVPLKTPIPVYISYVTAFLGPDGLMHYRRDVYGRDKNLLDALARRGQGAWEK